jgi:hypothetical protein
MSISPDAASRRLTRMASWRPEGEAVAGPLAGFGCSIDAVISSLPPGGAWKSSRVLSIRPDVQVPPLLMAFSTRWPLPSR